MASSSLNYLALVLEQRLEHVRAARHDTLGDLAHDDGTEDGGRRTEDGGRRTQLQPAEHRG